MRPHQESIDQDRQEDADHALSVFVIAGAIVPAPVLLILGLLALLNGNTADGVGMMIAAAGLAGTAALVYFIRPKN